MKRVLDAYALMAFFEREPGHGKIGDLLFSAAEDKDCLLMTSVNYGEVLYIVLRENGQERAETVERSISSMPIEIIPVDRGLAKKAARIKAFNKLAFADCFAAALAESAGAELITGDPEFKVLEKQLRILWIA